MQRQLSSSAMPRFPAEEEDDDEVDVEAKPEKAPAARTSPAKERSVHLIPLVTVLCFLLLFLRSHDPSPADMSSFGEKIGSRRLRLF